MKIILRSAVDSLGRAGDIKDVSRGYARNFLIPRGLAVEATGAAVAWWEKGKEKRAKQAAQELQEAKDLAAKISGTALSFARQIGAEGKLFGSVGKTDIVKSLKTAGYAVDKNAVALEAAIKIAGEHEVELKLMPDVSAKIKVSVVARQ